jgi:hypothetical protein
MRRDFTRLVSVMVANWRIDMQTTTLVRIVRDPRSGEVHVPNERVSILAITQNLDRTLLRVRWEGGGDCVIFPDDVDEKSCPCPGSRNREATSHATALND